MKSLYSRAFNVCDSINSKAKRCRSREMDSQNLHSISVGERGVSVHPYQAFWNLNRQVSTSHRVTCPRRNLLCTALWFVRLEGNGFSPPLGYRAPQWPSLYWPFDAGPNDPQYLYYPTGIYPFASLFDQDIWRFTLFWTFAIFGVVFLAAGLWAWSVYFLKTKWAVLIPILYVLSGEFIALVSGTIVGISTPRSNELRLSENRFHTCCVVQCGI